MQTSSSENLSVGKIRGLTATSSPEGVFNILAFDHRQSFIKMIHPKSPGETSYKDIVTAKSDVVRALAPHASAVLLDPLYSAAQTIANGALPGSTGLIVAVEETGYSGSPDARVCSLLTGWSVEKIKRMGADGVKLLVYYHPHAGEVSERLEQLTAEVIQACRREDIALFLEPVSYSIDRQVDKKSPEFAAQRPGLIAEIARRLGSFGPEVLKLEFPVDVTFDRKETNWKRACEAVSEASPCPWTVLSAGVDFELFTQQVEIACQSGASGCIAGRALWKEGIPLPLDERKIWLRKVASRRLDILSEITSKYGRPWIDFPPLSTRRIKEGWYISY